MATQRAMLLGHLQSDPRSTLACRTFFHGLFLSSTNSRKASSQLLAKQIKMVPKKQRKTWFREYCTEQFTLPHNVKIHNIIQKNSKVDVPTKWFVSKQQRTLYYRPWYQIKAQRKFFMQCADIQIFVFAYSWVLIKKNRNKRKFIEKIRGVPRYTLHICQLLVNIDYQAGYLVKA